MNTSAVIVAAIISLLGLGWVQYSWLQDSIATNKQIFEQKIDLASGLIKKAMSENHEAHLLINADIDTYKSESQHANVELVQLMDSVMYYGCGLEASFEYGIYAHKGSEISKIFSKVTGSSVPDILNFENCTEDELPNFGWLNISCQDVVCNQGASGFHYHVGLFFPKDNLYLISQMKETLAAAFIFILVLTACFSYTIITIRKQKKLSTMKNDFINNLTHEFKTPIFSIDLAAGMLAKAPQLANFDKLKSYAALIKSENERLKNQVDKILQVALVDSDNFRLEKKQINIHELIIKVVENFKILINERSGQIKLSLNASKTQLYADEIHIKNIIYNLLDNAQKYSPSKPQITIATEDAEQGVILQIEDNGIGMSEQVQKYVFDKFYRADASDVHNVKGFGLGLSYVKSVTDAHGVNIRLISSPNEGSKFYSSV